MGPPRGPDATKPDTHGGGRSGELRGVVWCLRTVQTSKNLSNADDLSKQRARHISIGLQDESVRAFLRWLGAVEGLWLAHTRLRSDGDLMASKTACKEAVAETETGAVKVEQIIAVPSSHSCVCIFTGLNKFLNQGMQRTC